LVKLKGFQKLTPTEDALSKWLGVLKFKKPSAVNVTLSEALYRVLEEDAIADESLPRFDRSAMDGYALNSKNTAGGSQFKPTLLQLTQSDFVGSKQAKQVWTGNPIPKGADAVVMIEKTQKRDDVIEVWTQLAPNENVSRVGEDLKKGEVAIKAGTRLNPYHLALLAALGKTQVKVTKKPTIAILATGNELAELGSKPGENQVFDSNRTMLSAMCRELGAEPLELGIARDDVEEIAEKIKCGLKQADAAITTGGTSVGGLDLVPDAVNKLGTPGVLVQGVAMRPGMPTALAVVNGKPVMVLSGNPVAAIVGFEVFARPLISKMMGIKKEALQPTVKAVMTRRVSSALGRKTFVRVKAFMKNGEVFAEPVSAKGSGAISTMTRGNGFVVVPENREGVAEGEVVPVRLFAGLETDNEDV
jgi:molybdopterin molybdotransferase